MGKIIRLTESDLTRLVNRVITEQEQQKNKCMQNVSLLKLWRHLKV